MAYPSTHTKGFGEMAMTRYTAWDVGMNSGRVAEALLARGWSVVGFEPYNESFQTAMARLTEYVGMGSAALWNVALSDEDAGATLWGFEGKSEWSSIVPGVVGNTPLTADLGQVRVRRASSIANELGVPDLLCCDVEGAEIRILSDLFSSGQHPRAVKVELSRRQSSEIFDLLESAGYARFALTQESNSDTGWIDLVGSVLDGARERWPFQDLSELRHMYSHWQSSKEWPILGWDAGWVDLVAFR